MIDREKYQTVITSLPVLPVSYHDTYKPLSGNRLRDRLGMLDRDDFEVVEACLDFLQVVKKNDETDEHEMFFCAERILAHSPSAHFQQIFRSIVNQKMIVAALRLRNREIALYTVDFGYLSNHIRRNWNHPTFKLGERYPWIHDIRLLLEKAETAAAQRRIDEVVWLYLRMQAQRHLFDLEAVLLYIFRWGMTRCWAARNKKVGEERILTMVEEALDGYGHFA
jgi:hypothetical protein